MSVMKENTQYVILPSNAQGTNAVPQPEGNKSSKFTINLGQTLRLPGTWLCGLVSLIYPRSYEPIGSNERQYIKVSYAEEDRGNGLMGPYKEVTMYFPKRPYLTAEELEMALNEILHEEASKRQVAEQSRKRRQVPFVVVNEETFRNFQYDPNKPQHYHEQRVEHAQKELDNAKRRRAEHARQRTDLRERARQQRFQRQQAEQQKLAAQQRRAAATNTQARAREDGNIASAESSIASAEAEEKKASKEAESKESQEQEEEEIIDRLDMVIDNEKREAKVYSNFAYNADVSHRNLHEQKVDHATKKLSHTRVELAKAQGRKEQAEKRHAEKSAEKQQAETDRNAAALRKLHHTSQEAKSVEDVTIAASSQRATAAQREVDTAARVVAAETENINKYQEMVDMLNKSIEIEQTKANQARRRSGETSSKRRESSEKSIESDLTEKHLALPIAESQPSHKVFQAMSFSYDLLTNRFKFTVNNRFFKYMEFSEQLGYALGFSQKRYTTSSHADHPPDLEGGIHHLYVYANGLVEPLVVGDTTGSLLRIVTVKGKYGERAENIYDHPMMLRVMPNEVHQISIDIRSADGRLIPFEYGSVVVTLVFKRAIFV